MKIRIAGNNPEWVQPVGNGIRNSEKQKVSNKIYI